MVTVFLSLSTHTLQSCEVCGQTGVAELRIVMVVAVNVLGYPLDDLD